MEESEYKRLNLFMNKDRLEEIKKEWDEALKTPVMTLRSDLPDFASSARHRVFTLIHDEALKVGLPEIDGFYGCDLLTGEFLKTEEI